MAAPGHQRAHRAGPLPTGGGATRRRLDRPGHPRLPLPQPPDRHDVRLAAATHATGGPAGAAGAAARGEREGRLAVGWWRQHALADRPRAEQAHTARIVLAGIDGSDAQVLRTLPRFDVAGYDADRYQAHAPTGAPAWSDLPDLDRALVIDTVRDGFTDGVCDGVAACCAALLDTDVSDDGGRQ
ncbi:hypothetical protein [Micromonospora sp. 4G55]|uniref:hypothetical protein n=1 Tax=Micromonospora sp. 4G55 TaxID=2806102 RepID=UPI001A388283|nr:hypothetical protein [Micromonospora sp. 4G55]MBM0255856.1 hypothetical protein [Micromonospora sp. 4G55]